MMDFFPSKIQLQPMSPNFNAMKKLLSKKSWRWRLGLFMTAAFAALPPANAGDVSLNLLDGKAPTLDAGISFGVPWPQGAVGRDAAFRLSAPGRELPVQSWPLAYWPDGSLKWSGFATVVPAGLSGPVTLSTNSSTATGALKVTNDGNSIVVDTGVLQCSIPLAGGENLVDSMTADGRVVAGAGQLV
jgi:hypothetical protein